MINNSHVYFIMLQLMRSISIVYKKSRKQSNPQLHSGLHTIRRSVDEYYTKLVERQKIKDQLNNDKKQMLERIKLNTAKNQRINDKYHLLDSMNVVAITRQPQEEKKQELTKSIQRGFVMRRVQSSKIALRALNLPNNLHQYLDQDEVFDKNNHLKLKKIYKIKSQSESKPIIIVLSVSFIINEHSFWQQENIEEVSIKYWKYLQVYASIVWVCQRQQTCKKLTKFAKNNSLRLDAIYLIQQRKNKKMLTINYQGIQAQYGIKFHKHGSPSLHQEKKMIVINGLRIQNIGEINGECLINSVPILQNYLSVVHFIKLDVCDKQRLGNVIKVLTIERYPKPLSIDSILNAYSKKIVEKFDDLSQKQEKLVNIAEYSSNKPNLLERIQQVKRQYMRFFSQSCSLNLNEKIKIQESQNSIQFIIGDILRRNYKIFKNYEDYSERYDQYIYIQNQLKRLNEKRIEKGVHKKLFSLPIKKYRNLLYIWQF